MPQRFLRPGLRTSDRWNSVSWPAQSLFTRILTLVDDWGRYDGRILILHGECFALRPDVTPQDTAAFRSELQTASLISVYTVEGKEFIQVERWQERARGERSKYPDPVIPQDSAADGSGWQEKDASLAIAITPSPSPLHHRHEEAKASLSADADANGIGEAKKGSRGTGERAIVPATDPVQYEAVMESFHRLCTSLPRIREITEPRKKAIRARWKNANGQALARFEELFAAAKASDFLSGRNGQWTGCSFDWLLSPTNSQKVLEGNYANDRSEKSKPRRHPSTGVILKGTAE